MADAKPPLLDHALARGDVLAFLERDWGAARRAKDSWWLAQVSERGPEVALAASETVSMLLPRTAEGGSDADASALDDLLRYVRLLDAANAALRR